MKKRRIRYGVISTALLMVIAGCFSPNRISVYNLAQLYRPETKFTRLYSRVYHVSDSLSTAFIGINLADLLYEKPFPEADYSAVYEISYRLQDSYEAKNVIDSAVFRYVDSVNFGKDIMMIHSIAFPAEKGNSYVLDLQLRDVQRLKTVREYLEIHKGNLNGQQSFMPITAGRQPLFRNYVSEDEEIKVRINDTGIDKLYVRCYFREFPIASPPFVTEKTKSFDYRADSLFVVKVVAGETGYMTFPRKGFYHFQKDTASREGFTLFRYHNNYPELVSPRNLLEPLRYITTKNEYDEMASAGDIKIAVDNFWLSTAGNELRARNLIQRYYGNVLNANEFFYSYQEGWKTDRGMVYIIFGSPKVVYRGSGLEEWIYGEPENRNALRFTFVQVINPFTFNDYLLLRSSTLKEPWYINVQQWRR